MKTKRILYSILFVLLSIITACCKAQTASSNLPKKVLIVYLSRTRNTQAVAEMIQKEVGGKLVPLELITPYPQNYRAQVAQVVKENNSGFLPPLKTRIDHIAQYDVIFIGFPTWDMKMPPPVKSFLKQYNLRGKTIIPFNTNAGYGTGSSFQTVKELCPYSTVLEGYSTRGGIERDGILFAIEGDKATRVQSEVKEWLQRLSIFER